MVACSFGSMGGFFVIDETTHLFYMGQLSGRSIRTFVLRQGRLTEGQQRSLDMYWGQFGIDVNAGAEDALPEVASKPVVDSAKAGSAITDTGGNGIGGNDTGSKDTGSKETGVIDAGNKTVDAAVRVVRDESLTVERIDPHAQFNQQHPLWMEIGIGNGDALVHMASHSPAVNFLGVEVHLPGIGHALGEIAEAELSNVRLIRYDVVDLIEHYLQPASVDRVLIFFPDPWHKTRHHKRRLVNTRFLDMLARLLTPAGMIHFASDWVPYAEQVQQMVTEHPRFELMPAGDELNSVVQLRPETHFERRGLKLGHRVTDLVIRKRVDDSN